MPYHEAIRPNETAAEEKERKMPIILVGCFLLALAAIASVTALAIASMQQAATIAVAQHEAGAKYSTVMMQVAMRLAKDQEDAVRARVNFVNRVINRETSPDVDSSPIEEAPMPPISQTGTMDEAHEVMRELARYRREADQQGYRATRDLGVGVSEEF